MKNNEDLFINITPGEAPDLDMELSSEEKVQLTESVLQKIQNKQKQQLPKEKRIIKFERRIVSLVAAAALLVVSTTAIAAIYSGGLKPKHNKQETQVITQTEAFSETTEITATSENLDVVNTEEKVVADENQRKYVNLNVDALEDYTMTPCGGGWYSFENIDSTLNFDCQVIYADTKWSRDYIVKAGIENSKENVPVYKWMFVEGKKALHVKHKNDWVYSQQLYVRYNESKYTLNILVPPEINKKELIEIGKKVTLEICSEKESCEYINFSRYLENYSPDEMKGEIPMKEAVDYSKVTYLNQTITTPQLQATVTSVKSHNNIGEFISESMEESMEEIKAESDNEKGQFFGQIAENANLFTYSDGSLCPYTRSYVYVGDGINTPKQKIVYQNVQQKFYTVEVVLKNTSSQTMSDISLLYPLKYINDNEDSYYDIDVYTRPVGVNSCQIYNQPKYFSPACEAIVLEPGEEKTVELGYFVDSDLDDNMFMSVLDLYVDIRK